MQSLVKWVVEVVLIAVLMLLILMWGVDHGKKQGMMEALKTNPVSEELEMACAALWVGEQNKKVMEKK